MENGEDTLAVPLKVPPPVFWTVKLLSKLVPVSIDPKSWLDGVTDSVGGAYALPLTGRLAPPPPVNDTFWLCVPADVGLYRTVTVWLWLAPRL